MKKNLILAALIIPILSSCDVDGNARFETDGKTIAGSDSPDSTYPIYPYNIVTIDSCEYIEISRNIGSQGGLYTIAHKGNCKNPFHKESEARK